MKGPLSSSAASASASASAGSASSSRSNSIEITSETTLNQLRALDMGSDHHDHFAAFSTTTGTSATSSRTKNRHMHDMGRSLNFLNLDQNRRPTFTPSSKTVGGASPRLRMMQLRLNRLKKTSPQERLYQSDSALFSSANAADSANDGTHATKKIGQQVWFKSLYPKQGGKVVLERLDEAEQEFEESQRSDSANNNNNDNDNSSTGRDFFCDMMNTSGTDMWLFEANQSAPGFLPGEEQKRKERAKATVAAFQKKKPKQFAQNKSEEGGDEDDDDEMEQDEQEQESHVRERVS